MWLSDKMGDKEQLPSDHTKYEYLSKAHDSLLGDINAIDTSKMVGTDAENERRSDRQLVQHLKALILLTEAAYKKEALSEDLIKSAHRYLMEGLYSHDGEAIAAGTYREKAVHSGTHSFPDVKEVPGIMARIVARFNEKASQPHDPIELSLVMGYFMTL